jgi:methyl-accepting chemotaxis protein
MTEPIQNLADHKSLHRKPFANFFIKRQLQMRLIWRIVITVLSSTVICLGSLFLVYFARYKSVLLYQLTPDGDLTKEQIWVILLPSLIVAGVVNIIVGALVGMYASRKYAVPIYKLEQWAMLLLKGHFTARLNFREREEMKDLSKDCNQLVESLKRRFQTIRIHAENLKKKNAPAEDVKAITDSIADLELEADSIDVHTNFFTLPPGHGSGSGKS